jgi:hypothetical protein
MSPGNIRVQPIDGRLFFCPGIKNGDESASESGTLSPTRLSLRWSELSDKLATGAGFMHQDQPNARPTDSTGGVQGEADFIRFLGEWIRSHEEWLMDRILFYAKRQGYTRYTSALREAWRISVGGLSASILEALRRLPDLELSADEDYTQDPAAAFGLIEARRHRQRRGSLPMFLGLLKYYRQSYQDLIEAAELMPGGRAHARRWVDRFFDRVEIAFCNEWVMPADEDHATVVIHEDLTRLGITDINILRKEEVLQEMQRALTQGRNYFSFRHRLSSGEIRDVEVFSGPIPFEGQSFLCSFRVGCYGKKNTGRRAPAEIQTAGRTGNRRSSLP